MDINQETRAKALEIAALILGNTKKQLENIETRNGTNKRASDDEILIQYRRLASVIQKNILEGWKD